MELAIERKFFSSDSQMAHVRHCSLRFGTGTSANQKRDCWEPIVNNFDGTSELWEAIAIAVRLIDSEWSIQQRLIQFEVLAKSLWDCSSVDQHLVSTVQHTFRIACSCNAWLCLIQQHCNVALKIVYPSVFIHYTVYPSGETFSHSFKAQLMWKKQTGRPICGYFPTQWWSSAWETMNQWLELFGDLEPFLKSTGCLYDCISTGKQIVCLQHVCRIYLYINSLYNNQVLAYCTSEEFGEDTQNTLLAQSHSIVG